MKTSKEESEKIKPVSSIGFSDVVASLLQDPIVRKKMNELHVDSSFVEKNIPLFLTYQESMHACKRCKGMDFCTLNPPFHTMDLFIDDSDILNRTYGHCHFLIEQEKIKNGYLCRDFPEESLSLSLERMENKEDAAAFSKKCANAIRDKMHPWVYLNGDTGAGKTMLAVATTNRLVRFGCSITFLDCVKRFDEFKNLSIKNKALFEKTMNQVASSEILVLDDFGNEYKSDYVRDQILMPLLSYRAKKSLPTFFTSNYSLDEIKTLYSTSRSGSIIAKRLVSLIESKIDGPYCLHAGFQNYL